MSKGGPVLLMVAMALASAAAQAPTSTARIRGRVVAAATGRPVRLATVRLSSAGNPDVATVKTDANGQYEITGLPAGRYNFYATHPSYLEQNFDQPRPLARWRLLELAQGEQLDGMDFSLHRGAVITGIITDEAGDPMTDVRVMALREQHGPYGRVLSPGRMSLPTDDEGRFRISGLLPGKYAVSAIARKTDESPVGFGRTYYPGTLNETEARVIQADLGQDAIADFSMIPTSLVRVAGIVRDSQGRPFVAGRITMTTASGVGDVAGAALDADGNFSFGQIEPGRYVLHVRPRRGEPRLIPTAGEWASVPINVAGDDISDLIITTSSGFVVSGRVVFEGSAPPLTKGLKVLTSEVDRSRQQMAYSSLTPDNGVIDAAGRFRIVGVSGTVRIVAGSAPPPGWFFKRASLNGVDVSVSGFDVRGNVDGLEVMFTDRATTITGTTRDAHGIGVKDYIVTFFPVGQFDEADRARRLRTIRPDPDGIYRIRNLPPGEYVAAAVPVLSLPIGGEWDPEFAERVRPGAIGFKLAEGQSLALTHRLTE